MLTYRVPQREIQVVVHLKQAEPLPGFLFVPTDGPGGVPQRLSDRLLEPGDRFLALARDGESHLIARDWILRIEVLNAEESEREHDPGDGQAHDVVCRLVDGSRLEGTLSFAMPAGRQRLLDYVNSVEGFVPLHTGGSLSLINQRHVVAWTGR